MNLEISRIDRRLLHTPPFGHPSPEGTFDSNALTPLYEEGWRALSAIGLATAEATGCVDRISESVKYAG